MALINCPECDKEISNKAKTCPPCGVPVKKDAPGCAPIGCILIALLPVGIFVSICLNQAMVGTSTSPNEARGDTSTSRNSEPYPTDSVTQQKLADEIERFETVGVLIKIRVVSGDQVGWMWATSSTS
ncbi:hypothetical protein Cflav_PD5958 [Pedosphaera parvula Ellin514]|uniref:Zinc-ribbon domain-containing protein n=1 Tax=Pedosphaera parvula (strain Ellin514) TaxID=320771 RepID=B9X9Y2_PEDPL|nr:hypothetical protein Cflav_PD5958 [Pedosphaera parvula Ellin514]